MRFASLLYVALLAYPALLTAQDTAAARPQSELAREADSVRGAYADSVGRAGEPSETVPPKESQGPSTTDTSTAAVLPGGRPCAAGKVLESCRQAMLNSALKKLMGGLKDPYTAKLDPQIAVTHEVIPVVCGRVNAKNSYGGYTGMDVFVYSLALTLGQVMFPSQTQDSWKKDMTLKALKRCTEIVPGDFMAMPAEYQKYVER